MPVTCIAHLVRKQNGLEPFEAFIESYRRHRAGIEHDLVLIFKGFDAGDASLAAYEALVRDVAYRKLLTGDEGFDIAPYFRAARTFDYHYFCFLNSYSVLLDDDWLAKMSAHASREGVGIVGASGSWESLYTSYLNGMPVRRRPPGLNFRGHVAQLFFNLLPVFRFRSFTRKTALAYRQRRQLARLRAAFNPFPNYHIRSNAFMIARNVMLRLRVGAIRRKSDAEMFESGRRGMTRQILDANLRALVVGRDGEAYEKERWPESRTFRSGAQDNLLVSDNRTRQYENADAETRRLLSLSTWGDATNDGGSSRAPSVEPTG